MFLFLLAQLIEVTRREEKRVTRLQINHTAAFVTLSPLLAPAASRNDDDELKLIGAHYLAA